MNAAHKEEAASAHRTGLNHPVRAEMEGVGQSDHFLRLMFFQPSDVNEVYAGPRVRGHAGQAQAAQADAGHSAHQFFLPDRNAVVPVSAESPAIEVMTDLRHVAAITVPLLAGIDEANRVMIGNAVRALFVADDLRRVQGMVTASDILGEKPVKIAQQRGIRHDEILVRDIMTPADLLEVIKLDDVLHAQVGDVVALLKHAGRQHALVVDPRMMVVRGIFSLAQIARQLGIDLQSPVTARSFAEIEAAIAN